MNSPILILANLLILMMVFLVVPVWIIVRLKQPSWTKLLLGFNYFALLIILFVQISAMGSLFHANQVAKKNCEALIRALRNEPAEKVAAAAVIRERQWKKALGWPCRKLAIMLRIKAKISTTGVKRL